LFKPFDPRICEGERAKQMENPTLRGPLESNAKRYAVLAERLEAARKQQAAAARSLSQFK
jgi:hypothetical protein